MSIIETLLSVAEEQPLDVTRGLSNEKDESDWYSLPPVEELLTLPNLETANQTQVVHVNGSSSTFGITLEPLSLFPPGMIPAREYFRAIQKWEGHVTRVGQDTFHARLVPIKGVGSDQEAEIYLDEIKEEDHSLIELGAVFYWSIGYLDRPSGRLRASLIRFRRLPVWTKREIKKATARATKLKDLFDAE